MKKIFTLFPSRTYPTPDGTLTYFFAPPELWNQIGMAKTLRVQMRGARRSDPNAYARVRFYETCIPDGRPSNVGIEITATVQLTTSMTPDLVTVSGPFAGRVEPVLEVWDSDSNDDPMDITLEVHVTAILEE